MTDINAIARWGLKSGAPEGAERKTFTPTQLKLTETGEVTVAFAQIGVVDRDDDLTEPGAFPTKSVPMSAYGHSSWMGELPTGKGAIHEEGGWAIFSGAFFMQTDQGRNTHQTVKDMAELQEWSYGYLATDYEFVERDGKTVRILKKVDVYEVSPVLVGAGVGTHTRAIKTADLGAGLPYAEHLSLGLETVKAILVRSKDRAEFRAKEGRTLSKSDRERLTALADELGTATGELRGFLDEADPGKAAASALEIEGLLARARFLGVQI
jgi:hypothetical protein